MAGVITALLVAVLGYLAVRLVLRLVGRVRATTAAVRARQHWIWIGIAVIVALAFAYHR